MIAEVYDALREAGAPDDKARRAAEVLASGDARHSELLVKFKELEVSGSRIWKLGLKNWKGV
jgi:hypothetical protein